MVSNIVRLRKIIEHRLLSLIVICALLTSCGPNGSQTQAIATPSVQPQTLNCKTTHTGFCWPTGEQVVENNWLADSCSWSGNDNYFTGEYHIGADIVSKDGKDGGSVYAIADGEVFYISSGEKSGWPGLKVGKDNKGVLVKHKLADGTEFLALYGHIITSVKVGDVLTAGQPFAKIGPYDISKPHLHFGIRPNTTVPLSNWGKMDCPKTAPITDKNGFEDPIEWITSKSPFGITSQIPVATFTPSVLGVTAPPISSELPPLNRNDYYSVLQWIKYAMANNDISVFEELVKGDLGQWIFRVGKTENVVTRMVFLNDLATRLPSKPYCDRYSYSGEDWMAIWTGRWSPSWEVKEICDPNCVKLDPPAYNDSLNFTLQKGTDGWEIVEANIWSFDETMKAYYDVTMKAHYMVKNFLSCDEVPISSTAVSTPSSFELPPLNRNDYYSVLQWIKYAFANNDMSVFKELVTGDLGYVSYIEGDDPVTRSAFLDDLSTRLPSGPHCDSFTIYKDSSGSRLDVWSTGWSPKWVMDQLCHAGCDQLNPPATTDVIAFSLLNEGSGWHIDAVPFGERPSWWADTYHYQIIDCDIVQFSPALVSVPSTSNIPTLNQAEYFSVLQWIKYAALNNDISVFDKLIVGDSIQLIDGNGKTVTINKSDFLGELSKRLLNRPNSEYFMFDSSNKESGRLIIRISNWSPSWDVNGSTIVYLILEMKNNQWVLTSIIFSDSPPSWAEGLEQINYDTISLSAGNTTEVACKEARPTRLKIGDFAFISFYPPLVQRVRSGPGTTNSILTTIPTGTAVKILDGPQCADNWVWWKIRVLSSKLEGWTSEGDKDAYWLIPCESRNNCGTR
jgi:murein DD-endopeptidase MepM/ murein hydrolase activator NlpD